MNKTKLLKTQLRMIESQINSVQELFSDDKDIMDDKGSLIELLQAEYACTKLEYEKATRRMDENEHVCRKKMLTSNLVDDEHSVIEMKGLVESIEKMAVNDTEQKTIENPNVREECEYDAVKALIENCLQEKNFNESVNKIENEEKHSGNHTVERKEEQVNTKISEFEQKNVDKLIEDYRNKMRENEKYLETARKVNKELMMKLGHMKHSSNTFINSITKNMVPLSNKAAQDKYLEELNRECKKIKNVLHVDEEKLPKHEEDNIDRDLNIFADNSVNNVVNVEDETVCNDILSLEYTQKKYSLFNEYFDRLHQNQKEKTLDRTVMISNSDAPEDVMETFDDQYERQKSIIQALKDKYVAMIKTLKSEAKTRLQNSYDEDRRNVMQEQEAVALNTKMFVHEHRANDFNIDAVLTKRKVEFYRERINTLCNEKDKLKVELETLVNHLNKLRNKVCECENFKIATQEEIECMKNLIYCEQNTCCELEKCVEHLNLEINARMSELEQLRRRECEEDKCLGKLIKAQEKQLSNMLQERKHEGKNKYKVDVREIVDEIALEIETKKW